MGLGRRVSSLFKHEDGTGRKSQPALPVVVEDDERTIATATQASLRDEITRLEKANSQATQKISELNERLASERGESSMLIGYVSSQGELAARAETELRSVSNQLTTTQREMSALQMEHAALQNDTRALYGSNQEIRVRVEEQEREIQDLRGQLLLALQPLSADTRRVIQEQSRWIHEKKELEARFTSERAVCNQQISVLEDRILKKQQECNSWETIARDLDTKLRQENRRLAQLRSLFGSDPTPRQILFPLLVTRSFCPRREGNIGDSRFHQSHRAEHLTAGHLDVSLTEQGFATFVESLGPDTPGLDVVRQNEMMNCVECNELKIIGSRSDRNRSSTLSEFSRSFWHTWCGSSPICKGCLKEKLKMSISQDWWYDLDVAHQWLKCPTECGQALEIHRVEDFAEMLSDFTDEDIALLGAMFGRALALREALAQVEPRPSLEAISASIGLHQRLIALDVFIDPFDVPHANDDGPAELFDAGRVFMGSLDRDDLEIPIFTNLFKGSGLRDCMICTESFSEIDFSNEEQWGDVCEGYHGPWMSQVVSFPTREMLHCDHDMSVCKNCVAEHLKARLDQHGRNASGRLTCPICERVLSEDEMRCLASEETVQRYDKYLLLSHLSSDPNFRSCLRAGCDNGMIYEQTEYPDPRITCDECDFEMCFTHQIPWHTGMSCDQYDSQQQHGDPEYEQTRDWMQSNSKNCPGANCGVNIEKGNACFHMTCTQCRHEFCWECLGDWSRINPQPGTYVKEAHNAGCFFRESDLEPTQVSGTNLQEALRRRRRA